MKAFNKISLLALLCLAPLIFTYQSFASGLTSLTDNNEFQSSSSVDSSFTASLETEQLEFLPVDQAYQLQVSSSEQGLSVSWQIAPEYYLYRHTTKLLLNGQPLELSGLPAGKAMHDEFFGDIEAYYQNLQLDFDAIESASLLEVQYQGCADAGLCYAPQQRYFQINSNHSVMPLSEKQWLENQKQPINNAQQSTLLGLVPAIAFAFLGGLLLNVMPCVFPILSLKLMSLAQSGHKSLHAWVYTLGVIISFCTIALMLISLKQAGEQIGWGFQLQSTGFLWFLAYLFTVLALNMSGLVFFGGRLMGLGSSLTQGSTLKGDFFTGVLAVLVASPCSVPFMGAAVGFALTQSALTAMVVFISLGFGMALPFLVFSWIPALQQMIPKPGAWMEILKQLLAFPLFLTVVWLVWVLGRQTDSSVMAFALLGCVLLAFALWLLKFRSLLARLCLVASLAIAAYLPFAPLQNQQDDHWVPYSADTLAQALNEAKPVFINATADWCITCISNEVTVLSNPEVMNFFQSNEVVLIKADWTRQDPQITHLLNTHQRSGVPLYLWFDAQGKVKILPQLLSRSLILDLQTDN